MGIRERSHPVNEQINKNENSCSKRIVHSLTSNDCLSILGANTSSFLIILPSLGLWEVGIPHSIAPPFGTQYTSAIIEPTLTVDSPNRIYIWAVSHDACKTSSVFILGAFCLDPWREDTSC